MRETRVLDYRAAHAVPAFMVGGFVWCVLAIVLSWVDDGVLGDFAGPGVSSWLIILTPAPLFFAAFFLLRWLRALHAWTFAGSMALSALALSHMGDPAPASLTALRVAMATVSGGAAFLVLRGGARADARARA